MMERLSAGWRGRRVLLVGGENGLCDAMKAMLTEIGARATCAGTDADAQTLCRALGKGRTSAVLLLEEPKKGSLPERTAALLTVMTETREAGRSAVHAPVGRSKFTHTDSSIGRVARLARRSSPHNHPAPRGGLPDAGCRVWRAAAGRAGV